MHGQNMLKSKIEMISCPGLFDKKRLKAAPTNNSFRHMIFAEKPCTEKTMAARHGFKQHVFSFSFTKKGKC